MKPEDIEYFREKLEKMRDEILQKGEDTLEDMTEERTMYADPADRASAESDRSFTLRLRDRDRKLVHMKPWKGLRTVHSVSATNAGRKSAAPVWRQGR
jgi:RNA polymerase-binding protein DksA